jgi:NDP-sugar pyrophosphorylase family protein
MKTKEFNGIKFNIYTDTYIEGDFIKPDEAVYFENDIEITGRLEVRYLKCEKSINVHKSYIVREWEEIGKYQEIGGFQKIGRYQEIGGNLKAKSSLVQLNSKVKGKYKVEGRVFIGVCEWRDTTEEEETLECGKFVSGDIKYGRLKEVGLSDEPVSGKQVKIKLKDGQIIEGEIVE